MKFNKEFAFLWLATSFHFGTSTASYPQKKQRLCKLHWCKWNVVNRSHHMCVHACVHVWVYTCVSSWLYVWAQVEWRREHRHGWLAKRGVSTWKGDPRWIPSALFHFHSCQSWYCGLLRIVFMAHQCWYHPKHSYQARIESNWTGCVYSTCGGCRSYR